MISPEFENPLLGVRQRLGRINDFDSRTVNQILASAYTKDLEDFIKSGDPQDSMQDYLEMAYANPESLPRAFQAAIFGIYFLGPQYLRNLANRMSEQGIKPAAALCMDFEKGQVLTLGPIINHFDVNLINSNNAFVESLIYKENDRGSVGKMLNEDPSGALFLRKHIHKIRVSRVMPGGYIEPYEDRDTVLNGMATAVQTYQALFPFTKEPLGKM